MSRGRDLAIALINARETAKQIAKMAVRPITIEVQPIIPAPREGELPIIPPIQPPIQLGMSTHIDRRDNVSLPYILFDEDGSGTLKEMVLKSTESDFKVIITADNLDAYNNNWDWFHSRSQVVKEFAAFQENSDYILSIIDIKFTRSLKVSLQPVGVRTMIQGKLVIDEIFLKVEIRRRLSE